MSEKKHKSRRAFLRSGIALGISATAGCIGPLYQSEENKEPFSHPSMEDIEGQPFLGPKPSRETPIIVAFEDLACPSCATFHRDTFQELKDQYIDKEELTFVFRGVDIVYNWGSIAAQVQEAVYENAEDRVFELINSYYDRQGDFSARNEIEMSESLLDDLSIDNSDRIIEQVNRGEYKSNLKQDMRAWKNSGLTGTPSFNLFIDGKYRTKIVGAEDVYVFESVLDL